MEDKEKQYGNPISSEHFQEANQVVWNLNYSNKVIMTGCIDAGNFNFAILLCMKKQTFISHFWKKRIAYISQDRFKLTNR